MKRWTLAAGLIAALAARSSAAQAEFKSSTFEQASDLAAGQAAPAVYDGARSLPVLDPAAPSAAQNAAPAQTAAAAPITYHAPAPRVEEVPMPQGMEVAVLPRPSAAPRPARRSVAAPIGALIGLSAGFGIGLGLSKALA